MLLGLAMLCVACGAAQQTFTVELATPIFTTDPRYLSFTMDAYSMTDWAEANGTIFGNPTALALASHLAPAVLRFGGTEADLLEYVMCQLDNAFDAGSAIDATTTILNCSQWLAITRFAQLAGVDLMFTVNVATRTSEGAWNSSNFEQLYRFTQEQGLQVVAWELGNEPNDLEAAVGVYVTPQQMAADYATLRTIVGTAAIMGPATSNDEAAFEYLCQFAQSVKQYTDALSVFTYHHYYGPGPGLNISYFYNVTVMDSLIAILEAGQHCTQTIPDIEVWLGETATTALGGTEGISDTFVNGFLWLDKLCIAPLFGISVAARQDLYFGSYGLLGDGARPNPDYWLSVLFKQLVGPRVLSVEGSTAPGRTLRVYAFCTRQDGPLAFPPGAVTVVAINTNNLTAEFSISAAPVSLVRYEYHLTSPGSQLNSASVLLNGVALSASSQGALPAFNGTRVEGLAPFTMSPLSFAFFVLEGMNAPAC
eukprot:m.307979 g.307979  ORF g.307979 m.307979 type:complete len:480 (+) comp55324_c0_seq24:28-1467(+)